MSSTDQPCQYACIPVQCGNVASLASSDCCAHPTNALQSSSISGGVEKRGVASHPTTPPGSALGVGLQVVYAQKSV